MAQESPLYRGLYYGARGISFDLSDVVVVVELPADAADPLAVVAGPPIDVAGPLHAQPNGTAGHNEAPQAAEPENLPEEGWWLRTITRIFEIVAHIMYNAVYPYRYMKRKALRLFSGIYGGRTLEQEEE